VIIIGVQKKKKWVKQNDGTLERGFNQFVLLPVFTIIDSISKGKTEIYEPIIRALRLKISKSEWDEAQTKKKIL